MTKYSNLLSESSLPLFINPFFTCPLKDDREASLGENEELGDEVAAAAPISGSHHQKLRRHSSSGIKMLDTLLQDMRNRFVAHEEEVCTECRDTT